MGPGIESAQICPLKQIEKNGQKPLEFSFKYTIYCVQRYRLKAVNI